MIFGHPEKSFLRPMRQKDGGNETPKTPPKSDGLVTDQGGRKPQALPDPNQTKGPDWTPDIPNEGDNNAESPSGNIVLPEKSTGKTFGGVGKVGLNKQSYEDDATWRKRLTDQGINPDTMKPFEKK